MDPPRQDTFTESVSTLLERKVRGWLSGVLDDMRRSSPVHVQNWLNSLPETPIEPSGPSEQLEVTAPNNNQDDDLTEGILSPPLQGSHNGLNTLDKVEPESKPSHEDKNLEVPSPKDLYKRKSLESGVLSTSPHHENTKKKLQRDYSVQSEGYSPRLKNPLFRDASLQSDGSGSSGSSVLNVLGARKVDAESVLLELGFGPSEKHQKHQRIPERFLVPSKLKGISTEQFIKEEQHSMRMHDCGVFGYRGLTGNPHVPPSTIVAKIMDCILQDDVCREQASIKARHSVADLRSSAYTQLAARLLRDT